MTGQEEDSGRPSPSRVLPELETAPRLEPPVPSEPMVAPSQRARPEAMHADFASFHEGYVRHYIALADAKAGVVFTLAGGLLGYLLADAGNRATITEPVLSFEFVTIMLALVSLLTMAALAFFVIAPRLSIKSNEGLVYFGAVAKKTSSDDFLAEVASCSGERLVEARLIHCYDTAVICARKYELLKVAIWLTPLSLLFVLISLLEK